MKTNITKLKYIFIPFLFVFLFWGDLSFACSSCGSSAVSPINLYPNENLKVYVGTQVNYNYINYGHAGGDSRAKWISTNLATKSTLTLAVGYRTSQNSFISLTGSAIRNEGPNNVFDPYDSGIKTTYLLGDPIISGRYNLVNMSIDKPSVPQVQLVASYKPSFSSNMIDNPERDAIDTTGNGYDQFRVGVDLWWGVMAWQFGGSQFVTYSLDRYPDVEYYGNIQTKRSRSLQYTTILSGARDFRDVDIDMNIQVGVALDYTGETETTLISTNSGVTTMVTAPSAQSNNFFVTAKFPLTQKDVVRFSYVIGGFYDGDLGPFTNKNQTVSDSVLVGFEHTYF